jgi:Bifunctional DNA primase/polymerase, N-terminal
MPNDILKAALDYLGRGWSVVPVQGKQPLERWQRWQFCAMTPAQAERAFTRPEVTGVAVVCGKVSGLMVLDFDGQPGRDAYKDFCAFGLIEPERATVTTGSGGKHVYYPLESWARTAVWKYQDARAGELRADGGYVLAPPSLHPNGQLYTWDAPAPHRLEPMPENLREGFALMTAPDKAAPFPPRAMPAARDRVAPAVLLRKAESEARASGRNNAGFKLATWLRDNGYGQDEALNVMLTFAETVHAGQHTYTSSEARASLHSAYRRPARAPWGAPGVKS